MLPNVFYFRLFFFKEKKNKRLISHASHGVCGVTDSNTNDGDVNDVNDVNDDNNVDIPYNYLFLQGKGGGELSC